GLFTRDQSPSQAICSVLAMFWFWSGCKAEEKDLFLGSVLLGLARFLRSKISCLLLDLLSCFSCHRGVKGDKQPVTMSFSILGGWAVRFFWISRSWWEAEQLPVLDHAGRMRMTGCSSPPLLW
ncbi:unnamed protein product, partial [Tetraodon nigroviridis]